MMGKDRIIRKGQFLPNHYYSMRELQGVLKRDLSRSDNPNWINGRQLYTKFKKHGVRSKEQTSVGKTGKTQTVKVFRWGDVKKALDLKERTMSENGEERENGKNPQRKEAKFLTDRIDHFLAEGPVDRHRLEAICQTLILESMTHPLSDGAITALEILRGSVESSEGKNPKIAESPTTGAKPPMKKPSLQDRVAKAREKIGDK